MSELKSEKELKEYMGSNNFHRIEHPGLHPEWVMETEDLHKQEDLWKNREIHYNFDDFSTIVFHKDGQEWRFPLNKFFDKLMRWMEEDNG